MKREKVAKSACEYVQKYYELQMIRQVVVESGESVATSTKTLACSCSILSSYSLATALFKLIYGECSKEEAKLRVIDAIDFECKMLKYSGKQELGKLFKCGLSDLDTKMYCAIVNLETYEDWNEDAVYFLGHYDEINWKKEIEE